MIETMKPITREHIKIPAGLTAPQTIDVFCYLVSRVKITDNQARDILNCNRVAARISDLRHLYGVEIKTEMKSRRNRKGRVKTFAQYTLMHPEEYRK